MYTFADGRTLWMNGMGQIAAPFQYFPDLSPVGSGSAYFPRSVAADAQALNFLGFLTDAELASLRPSTGTQSGDMNGPAGAWAPAFRGAMGRFQASAGITADTWVGPQSRGKLATAVSAKNANPGALPPPPPNPDRPVPVNPGTVPALPTPLPGVTPASASSGGMSTGAMVGIGVGVLALGAGLWYVLK